MLVWRRSGSSRTGYVEAMAIVDEEAADVVHTAPGHTLAYAQIGDPDGTPVFVLHGTPGSRLNDALAIERFVVHRRLGHLPPGCGAG
jgi:hypothetical protein